MSHEIFGDRFRHSYGSAPAWHHLGTTWEEGLRDVVAAIDSVTAGIEFVESPLYYQRNGAFAPIAGQKAIIRLPTTDDPEHRMVGTATDRWHLSQYRDLASQLKTLAEAYPVETAGALYDGALVFACFRGDGFDVENGKGGKDVNVHYHTANLSACPGKNNTMVSSPVRVVCMNTNVAAWESASWKIVIGHGADAKGKFALASDFLAGIKERERKTKEIFDAMASTHCPLESMHKIFAAAFPGPSVPGDVLLLQDLLRDRSVALRSEQSPEDKIPIAKSVGDLELLFRAEGGLDAILAQNRTTIERLFKSEGQFMSNRERARRLQEAAEIRLDQMEPSWARGTVWGAFNAATEVAEWRDGANAELSAFAGARQAEKQRAFNAAYELIS